MPIRKKVFWILLSIILSVTSYFLLYSLVIYPSLIPDECYFHTHKPSPTVELFFDFPPAENGHPVAKQIGLVLTFAFGGLLGWIMVFFASKRKKKSTQEPSKQLNPIADSSNRKDS